MIDTIRLVVTDYINQLHGYYTYDHTSRYTIIPGSGRFFGQRYANIRYPRPGHQLRARYRPVTACTCQCCVWALRAIPYTIQP